MPCNGTTLTSSGHQHGPCGSSRPCTNRTHLHKVSRTRSLLLTQAPSYGSGARIGAGHRAGTVRLPLPMGARGAASVLSAVAEQSVAALPPPCHLCLSSLFSFPQRSTWLHHLTACITSPYHPSPDPTPLHGTHLSGGAPSGALTRGPPTREGTPPPVGDPTSSEGQTHPHDSAIAAPAQSHPRGGRATVAASRAHGWREVWPSPAGYRYRIRGLAAQAALLPSRWPSAAASRPD